MSIILNLDILLFSTEIFFFFSLLLLLLFGTLKRNLDLSVFLFLFVQSLFLIILILLNMDVCIFQVSFNLFNSNLFIYNIKLYLICLVILFSFLISTYMRFEFIKSFEYLILLGYSVFGLFTLISANDFLSLYLCLELQSLCFYVLAAYKYFSNFSAEAGIKYFVLGAISSGILLFGISVIYGITGTTNFTDIYFVNSWFFSGEASDFAVLLRSNLFLAFTLILSSFFFKLGAAPFHLWLPDVYEGAATITTAFFAIVPKFVIFGALVKIANSFYFFSEGSSIFIFVGLLSVFIGSFGALYQTKIKRLLAFSSITHVGFLLLSLSTYTLNGLFGAMFYLFFYTLISLNIFTIVLSLRKYNMVKIKDISHLSGLIKSNPVLAYCLGITLFSLAGIPPLMGFYSKFFIFVALINAKFFFVAFLLVILSGVSTFYYVRLIKIIFFDLNKNVIFLAPISPLYGYLISFLSIFNIVFCFCPDFIFIPLNNMVFNFIVI